MTVIHGAAEVSARCNTCGGIGEVATPGAVETDGHLAIHSFHFRQCPSCEGAGWIIWTRGVSLPPNVPRAGPTKKGR